MATATSEVLRFVHLSNLDTLIRRGGLHAPRATPNDGLPYRTIYGQSEQAAREEKTIPCGPGGCFHDYVPFYFGPLSPMMLRLKTGQVDGYQDGQVPLIYCVSTVNDVRTSGAKFVFSDGHGLARLTSWFDDPARLDEVDWEMVSQRYWTDTTADPDRQRRKQAEFLVYKVCPWTAIRRIVVINQAMKQAVSEIMEGFNPSERREVIVNADWYYR